MVNPATAWDKAQLARRLGDVTPTRNGIAFEWGYAGSAGSWFHLFLEPHHTQLDVQRAKRWLRRHHRVGEITQERVAKAGAAAPS
jgi:hypothetical protein